MSEIRLRKITKSYDRNLPVIKDLDLNIGGGSFTVLLGPSGCGKSTLLRVIAGLEPASGEVFIGGKDMSGVQPGDREIAMVFQNYALYPNMSVRENIEFGLKNMKIAKPERERRIKEISEMVGLEEYLGRKPQRLSGGQRQRVALARAIVKKPRVFLMDEPLSNLDAKLRAQIRAELIELHRNLGATFVYVTHDQAEAMSMGTDIVIMENGEIRQQDHPSAIYSSPRNLFAARFIGSPPMNILAVEALDEVGPPAPAGAAYVGFRPECALLDGNPSEFGGLNIRGELAAREILGDQVLYKLKTRWGDIYAKSMGDSMAEYGLRSISIKRENLYFFGADGGAVNGLVFLGALDSVMEKAAVT
jgi:sn-glycerol 3-phosphate transport system ATP-binding protein